MHDGSDDATAPATSRGCLGFVTLDGAGNLLDADERARWMLDCGDALRLGAGGLRALRASDDARLTAAIRAARMEGAACPLLTIPRRSGGSAYLVSIARCGAPAKVHVAILDPAEPCALPADLLRALYGLTTMQARVAERIAAGDRLATAAGKLGIQVVTARTHLGVVYRKTGTRSAADLVRALTLALMASEWSARLAAS